jgi:sugar transferase (PEP-CTERM/EpsH1 system associated)
MTAASPTRQAAVPAPLVAHIIYRLDFGGLENGLVNLINRMPPERYRHVILCLAGFSEFRRRIRRDDVELISLDKKPGKDPAMYLRLWRELRRLRPAVVHTRNLGTVDLQWIARFAGVPARVHGEHGWEASDPGGRNPRHLRIRRACRPVIQRYVSVSRDIARWLEQQVRVPARRVRQIYNGVDDSRFSRDGTRPADFPWPGGDTVVLGTVGRLDPIKNQLQLIQCFHRLVQSPASWAAKLRLIVVGDGPLRDKLAGEVHRLALQDRIWLTGARNDVPDVMRCMDVFVLPSLNEGISNTILEAMAMGLPVVAGAVGGNPELIVNGVTGALYEGNAQDALPGALQPLLDDPARRLAAGQAARQRAQQQFGLQSMVDGYLSLYDELLCAA